MSLKRLVLTILVVVITICTIKFQYDIVHEEKVVTNQKVEAIQEEKLLNNEVEQLK